MLQTVDGVSFKLKAPFDFGFLKAYGKVFKVFDQQDSGNLCFGVEKDGERYFVKFAGARTVNYPGKPRDAVKRLREAAAVYRDLRHEALIPFLGAREEGGGFSLCFRWVDSVCMGKMYPEDRARFLLLPLEEKCRVFDAVLSFHREVIRRGYVAVDFYDGSILYDERAKRPYLCDVDTYQKMPCVNWMGRLWGSSRFMSPEEFTLGAPIDEVTNVFLMGAVAFALFGGELDRSLSKWSLSGKRHAVALKAVSEDRGKRQQSVEEFIEEWG